MARHGPPKAFVDLHRLPEDDRIEIIGRYSLEHPGEVVGVPTDDEPGKPERYKLKLERKFPQLKVWIAGRSGGIAVLRVQSPLQG